MLNTTDLGICTSDIIALTLPAHKHYFSSKEALFAVLRQRNNLPSDSVSLFPIKGFYLAVKLFFCNTGVFSRLCFGYQAPPDLFQQQG